MDDDRKLFADTQTRVTQDSEKLGRDRESWLRDKESLDIEKRQIVQDRTKLEADRILFDQEKRAFASTTGRKIPGGSTETDGNSPAKNPKEVAKFMEDMSPESAARNLREMDASGNTDLVVDVLRLMEKRKAGAIVDALQDDELATKFLLRMSERNEETKAAKKP